MNTAYSKIIWTVGLMGISAAALADTPPPKTAPPQEPIGFVTGGVIGGFAAGPVGAVIGAGIGTWLGQRVHRAGEASKAEAKVAALENDKSQLQSKTASLESETSDLAQTNRTLTARLDELSHSVEEAQSAKDDTARENAAKVLDGLQGDVLFRTGQRGNHAGDGARNPGFGRSGRQITRASSEDRRLCGSARYRGYQPQAIRAARQCRARSVPRGWCRRRGARSQRVRKESERRRRQRRLRAGASREADLASGRAGAGRPGRRQPLRRPIRRRRRLPPKRAKTSDHRRLGAKTRRAALVSAAATRLR